MGSHQLVGNDRRLLLPIPCVYSLHHQVWGMGASQLLRKVQHSQPSCSSATIINKSPFPRSKLKQHQETAPGPTSWPRDPRERRRGGSRLGYSGVHTGCHREGGATSPRLRLLTYKIGILTAPMPSPSSSGT